MNESAETCQLSSYMSSLLIELVNYNAIVGQSLGQLKF